MDERQAIAKLRQGRIEGLETLVRLHQLRAGRAAYLVTRDLALADDVVQSAFVRAYERIDQLDPTRPFASGVGDSTVIFDGAQTWWRAVVGGHTFVARAVNVQIRDASALAPEGGSIAEALAQLVQVTSNGCATASVQGESTVAGRATYVVAVTPTTSGSCANPDQARLVEAKAAIATAAAKGASPASLDEMKRAVAAAQPSGGPRQPASAGTASGGAPGGSLTVWIDKQAYLPLRSEEVSPKGRSTYAVTSIDVDPPIADSTLSYTPPPDATVFSDAAQLKMALAGVTPTRR